MKEQKSDIQRHNKNLETLASYRKMRKKKDKVSKQSRRKNRD